MNVGNWGGGYGNWGGGYGNWGYPGGGYGGWGNGWVNPHYGWYNGCWNGGGWGGGYGSGWWAPFALGAASWGLLSSVGSWGLGYGTLGYSTGSYVNPYYSAMPAAVVASSPYDYSQPLVVNNYVTTDGGSANSSATATAGDPANEAVDAAVTAFQGGDYARALAGFDKALTLAPKDAVIHEVRALALFALGRYPEAASALNAVLAAAPGMDWTTISNVYGSVDVYTAHLRKLEEFCRAHPDDAGAHFVLAYHYLVGGHPETAAAALRVVVKKQPGDVVAKRMLEGLSPPAEAAPAEPAAAAATDAAPASPAPTGPETDLVGTWKATSGQDTIVLSITEESTFTWKATPAGRPAVELSGRLTSAADAIALETETAGTMVGKVVSKGADAFEFSLPAAPRDAKPLLFERQK